MVGENFLLTNRNVFGLKKRANTNTTIFCLKIKGKYKYEYIQIDKKGKYEYEYEYLDRYSRIRILIQIFVTHSPPFNLEQIFLDDNFLQVPPVRGPAESPTGNGHARFSRSLFLQECLIFLQIFLLKCPSIDQFRPIQVGEGW